MFEICLDFTGKRINLPDAVDFIPEKFDADCVFTGLNRKDLHYVAPNSEFVADKIHVIAFILDFDQLFQQFVSALFHAGAQGNHHSPVVNRIAQAVNAGNAGNDNHIAPLRKGRCGRVPQLVDFVIDGGIFLNIGIRRGNIGFRLIIVIIADKILYGVFREKLPEFRTKLGRQRFIVGQNQCGPVDLCDNVGHGECFSGTGYPQKGLLPVAVPETLHQLKDRFRLVAGRLIF